MYSWQEPTDLPADPIHLCSRLQHTDCPVLLHSGMRIGAYGDWSIVACNPALMLRSKGDEVSVEVRDGSGGEGRPPEACGDALETLERLWQSCPAPTEHSPLPFRGGFIGYLSYDLGRLLEPLPATARDDLAAPDMLLGLYTAALVVDHRAQLTWACGYSAHSREAAQAAARTLEQTARAGCPEPRDGGSATDGRLTGNFTREQYLQALRRTIEYIYAGDIFQANLSQRFQGTVRITPWELYRRFSEINPAPFAAYLGFDDIQLVSASPERFVLVREGLVETRPIKGTRPRGTDPAADQALARELLASEKDAAELTMIVDLERNDLGRVCRFGSVEVPQLVVLESYPTVHHLVATVVGRLRPEASNVDLLRATLPGGSITGAPKIRAMEIIEELEPTRRGPYTGCIGYLGLDGRVDLNIVIRTIAVLDRTAYFQVGGGIVADSDPEDEYIETLVKGRAPARALDAGLPQ